jgi:diguanylate cyclase (GGDEF)-like protein
MSNTEKIQRHQSLASRRLERNALLGWVLPMLLLMVMGSAIFYAARQMSEVSAQVVAAGEIIDVLNDVRNDLLDIETGERGYVITGKEAYLEPHQQAMRLLEKNMTELAGMLQSSPKLTVSFHELSQHVQLKLRISEANITARRISFDEAVARVNAGVGRQEMDSIRGLLNELDTQQHGVRDELRKQRGEIMQYLWIALIGAAVAVLLVSSYLYLQSQFFINLQRKADELAYYLATHDALTQLPNRSMLMDELQRMLSRAQRNASQSALLFLDLNGFKKVNDTLGHPVGDELLIQVAARLQALMRGGDLVARLSGDEFVVMLEGITHGADVQRVMDNIAHEIAQPFVLNLHTVHISTSVGAAHYPQDGQDAEALMHHADAAMYAAKRMAHAAAQLKE